MSSLCQLNSLWHFVYHCILITGNDRVLHRLIHPGWDHFVGSTLYDTLCIIVFWSLVMTGCYIDSYTHGVSSLCRLSSLWHFMYHCILITRNDRVLHRIIHPGCEFTLSAQLFMTLCVALYFDHSSWQDVTSTHTPRVRSLCQLNSLWHFVYHCILITCNDRVLHRLIHPGSVHFVGSALYDTLCIIVFWSLVMTGCYIDSYTQVEFTLSAQLFMALCVSLYFDN